MAYGFITPQTFTFLNDIARHNNREWFTANKQRYIDDVRDPLLHFIAAFGPRLARISTHMVADPRPMGGSLFRIYRDTRFSRDKRPYKTQAGMTFRHRGDGNVHGPMFYLHLESGGVFMAAGMWHPEPAALTKVRDTIVSKPRRWQRVHAHRACVLDDGHEGDRLKRPPRGYDPEHPFVEDLKRKSFTASARFTEAAACRPDFLDQFAKACQQRTPLMEFLTYALGLPW